MHICKMFRSLFALYEKVTICIRYLRYPNNYAYSGLSFWVFFLVFVFKYTTSKNGKINAMLILKKNLCPTFRRPTISADCSVTYSVSLWLR